MFVVNSKPSHAYIVLCPYFPALFNTCSKCPGDTQHYSYDERVEQQSHGCMSPAVVRTTALPFITDGIIFIAVISRYLDLRLLATSLLDKRSRARRNYRSNFCVPDARYARVQCMVRVRARALRSSVWARE